MTWEFELDVGYFLSPQVFPFIFPDTCAHAQTCSHRCGSGSSCAPRLSLVRQPLTVDDNRHRGSVWRRRPSTQNQKTPRKCRKVGTRNLPQPQTTPGDPLGLPWATKSPWCWALNGEMKGKEKLWISWLKTRIWCADVRLVSPHAAFTDPPGLASHSKSLSWSGKNVASWRLSLLVCYFKRVANVTLNAC